MKQNKDSIGLIGLGPMGGNLARNFRDKGYAVYVYDNFPEAADRFRAENVEGVTICESLADLVANLAVPRSILLMVKAGNPVDRLIGGFVDLLQQGDLIIDGGNSKYVDSCRRAAACEAMGLQYMDAGISGGEEGARCGAAIMVGGSQKAFAQGGHFLKSIAAREGDEICCARMGNIGAGHFVKMVHNGIEYALMQLMAEAYLVLHEMGMSSDEAGRVFATWNQGVAGSYLMSITAEILTTCDSVTGCPMVEVIKDGAHQKGTGRWAVEAAMDLGIPAPTLAAAVAARNLSALDQLRAQISTSFADDGSDEDRRCLKLTADELEEALLAAVICAYVQGLTVIGAANENQGGPLDPAAACRVWQQGSILRAKILENLISSLSPGSDVSNIFRDNDLTSLLASYVPALRYVVGAAIRQGVPVPGLSSALAYIDGLRGEKTGAALIQAQRDRFGAHGFQRVDLEGNFHGPWSNHE